MRGYRDLSVDPLPSVPIRKCGVSGRAPRDEEPIRCGLATLTPSPRLQAALESAVLGLPAAIRSVWLAYGERHGLSALLAAVDAMRESQRALAGRG